MLTAIETYSQMTEDAEGVLNPNITFRLKEAEVERLKRVLALAAERGGSFAKKSNVYRELIGLSEPRYLRQEEIDYFRTGRKAEGMFLHDPEPEQEVDLPPEEVISLLHKLGLPDLANVYKAKQGKVIKMRPRTPQESLQKETARERNKKP